MRSYVNALEMSSEKFVMIDRQRKEIWDKIILKKYQFCVSINKDSPSRRETHPRSCCSCKVQYLKHSASSISPWWSNIHTGWSWNKSTSFEIYCLRSSRHKFRFLLFETAFFLSIVLRSFTFSRFFFRPFRFRKFFFRCLVSNS